MPNDNLQIQPFAKPFDIGAQKTEGQEFISGLTGAIPGIRSGVEASLGLPELRQRQQQGAELIGGLQTQLFDLPAQVQGTTRESLITQSQLGRLQQKQAQPLLESLSRLSTAQAPLETALASKEALAGQRVTEGLLPFQLGFSLLEQQQARQASNYQFSEQQELDRLVANLNAGVTLSEGEKDRLNELAIKERGFKNELDQIKLTGEQARETKKAPADLASLFESVFG